MTVTSRQFNQDLGAAKRAAGSEPVIITDRGRPAHVLLSFADYVRIKASSPTIGDLLYMPGAEDSDFDIPRLIEPIREIDFD